MPDKTHLSLLTSTGWRLPRALACCLLLAATPLLAQQEETESNAEKKADDIVTLQEFRIDTTQEYGYRATSSMTAVRLSGQTIDTPMSVNILSSEFLEDLSFDSSQEVGRYIPNVLSDERVSSHDGGGTIYMRGFRTPKQRNGVESFGASNLNAVDRVEVIKGPVGVFYGNTAPGGIINIVTKKPEFINAGSVEYVYGSYNQHRASFDAQATAMENTLGVRVNGSYLNTEDWRDYEEAEEVFFTGTVRWRPRKRLDIVYEYENAKTKHNDGVNDVVGNPQRHAEYFDPPQDIVDYFRNKQNLASDEATIDYLRGRWLTSSANWANDHREATGEYVFRETGFIDPYLISPRGNKFNRNGEGAFDDYDSSSHMFNVSWGPTKWIAVRYQYYDIESERRDINNFFTDANADYSLRMRDNFNRIIPERRINQQVDIKLTFNTEGIGKHTVLYGHEHQHNFRWSTNGTFLLDFDRLPDLQIPADPWFKGGDIPLGPDPITVPGSVYRNRWNPYLHDVPNYSDAISGEITPVPITPTWLDGDYIAHLGSFFNKRLRTMVGMRWEVEDDGDKGETPSYGAVLEVIPGWHLYGSYSEQWRPNGDNVTGPGAAAENPYQLANEVGKGKDIGIKTNWKDNTLSGSISWFTLDRANIRQQDGARNDTDPRNLDNTQTNNVVWFELSGLERVKGVETDLVWTPNENFQLVLGYAWNYYAHIVEDPSRTIPFEKEFQNGRQLHNAPEHNLSVWGKYRFTEGGLKGLSVGLGLRATSEAESGNNQPFRYHINPGYTVWDGRISYETDKLIGKRTVFSLNVENMFDQRWYSGLAIGDPIKAYFKIKTYF